MATRKKKSETVDTDSYNKLEVYCIWLNEYFTTLLRAGFKEDVAMTIMMDKSSYPDWVSFKLPTVTDVAHYMDEDED